MTVFILLICAFFYKGYKRLTRKRTIPPWQRVEARVVASHFFGVDEMEVQLCYTVLGKEYYGTAHMSYKHNTPAPTTVELFYKTKNPAVWEQAEDHGDEETLHRLEDVGWFWLLLMIAIFGGSILTAVYLTRAGLTGR